MAAPAGGQMLDPGATQVILDPTPFAQGYFGWSLAASGPWLAVGALDVDPNGFRNGSVTMYEQAPGGQLVLRQVIGSSTPGGSPTVPGHGNGRFGGQVAIDGDRMVVAALSEVALIPTGVRFGVLHAFERDVNSGLWVETQVITEPSNPFAHSDDIGFQMRLFGDHLFASARHANRVRYYFHDGTGWGFVQDIVPPTTLSIGAGFGFGLDVDPITGWAVVGANTDELPGHPDDAGVVYVYCMSGGGASPYQFAYDATLPPPVPIAFQLFGTAVAVVDAERIAVVSEGSIFGSDEIQVFQRTGSNWLVETRVALPPANGTAGPNLLRWGSELYLNVNRWSDPSQPAGAGAMLAFCRDYGYWSLSKVLHRPPGVAGQFPSEAIAVGDGFVAASGEGVAYSGVVAIFRGPTPWDCVRATPAESICGASTAGCPGASQPAITDPLGGCPNSSGAQGRVHFNGLPWMHFNGTPGNSFNENRIWATGLPPGEMALLLRGWAPNPGPPAWNPLGTALGSGVLCLTQPTPNAYGARRVGQDGVVEWREVTEWLPSVWAPFMSWDRHPFQVWYRDRSGSGLATSNTTNAILVPIGR